MVRFRALRGAALAVVAVLLAAACGTTPTAQVTPTPPPPTPPPPAFRVTGTTPADGATGVAPNTAITITFSEPVVPGTVTFGVPGATITITPAPVVAPTLAVAGNTVTLAGGVYSSTATYTVSVAGTVQSLASGALLGSTFTFRFTTRAWTVGPTTLNLAVVGEGNIVSPGTPADVTAGPGTTIAGDTDDDLEQRGFVAFSLASLPPNAVVLTAPYTATQDIAGTPAGVGPYANFGNLLAEGVNWYADAALTGPDFIAVPVATLTASTAATAFVSFDAAPLVRPQLGQPTIGIRFRFQFPTDADGTADTVNLTPQNLTVVYGVL